MTPVRAATRPARWAPRGTRVLRRAGRSDGLGAGRPQDPRAEFDDEPVLLGDGDEVGGADEAALGVVPADEGFGRARRRWSRTTRRGRPRTTPHGRPQKTAYRRPRTTPHGRPRTTPRGGAAGCRWSWPPWPCSSSSPGAAGCWPRTRTADRAATRRRHRHQPRATRAGGTGHERTGVGERTGPRSGPDRHGGHPGRQPAHADPLRGDRPGSGHAVPGRGRGLRRATLFSIDATGEKDDKGRPTYTIYNDAHGFVQWWQEKSEVYVEQTGDGPPGATFSFVDRGPL
jgi:hypothetical protein